MAKNNYLVRAPHLHSSVRLKCRFETKSVTEKIMLQVGEMITVEDKICLQNLWIYFDDKRISATYLLFFNQ